VPLDSEPARIAPAIVDRQLTPAGFTGRARGQDECVARPLPPGPPLEGPAVGGAPPVMAPPPPDPVHSLGSATATPCTPDEMYNCGVVAEPVNSGYAPPAPPACCEPIGEVPGITGETALGDGRVFGFLGNFQWFKSDHAFDQMISPLSNPFLFEDPRALTEVRPMYIYQKMPGGNLFVNDGSINWWGTQARWAITDRWSIVIHKLGGIDFDPGENSLLPGGTSFSEFWIGPKWTFIRSPEAGIVAAFGWNFMIPTGNDQAFQNTGDLSMAPYLSFGWTFGRSDYGAFNYMASTGYTFSTDNTRTDYYWASLHLDYDIANLHKIYPVLELNYFHYAKNGGNQPMGFEGRDLINFGSSGISGHDGLSMAAGVRYKFTENYQVGIGVEFPISNTEDDLLDCRLMVDVIIRY
jgi:hypothetical protein